MNFIAIDFELANPNRASACALGMVEIRNSNVANEYYWLIDPQEDFDPFYSGIHGITQDMVEGKPSFKELWPDIHSIIAGQNLLAHNASFDMSVLRHCLQNDALDFPPFAIIVPICYVRSLSLVFLIIDLMLLQRLLA